MRTKRERAKGGQQNGHDNKLLMKLSELADLEMTLRKIYQEEADDPLHLKVPGLGIFDEDCVFQQYAHLYNYYHKKFTAERMILDRVRSLIWYLMVTYPVLVGVPLLKRQKGKEQGERKGGE